MTIVGYIIISVLFSALFSGIEIAFVSSNRFHIEVENKKGILSYQVISRLIKRPSRFIAAMLVGNNVALVIYGLFMPELLSPIMPDDLGIWVLLLQTFASTIVILVLAEFLPKAIFNTNPTWYLQIFAIPSAFFYYLFYPVVSFMIAISNFVLKYILKANPKEAESVFNKVDLDNYVKERTDAFTPNEEEVDTEIQIFKNALEFNEIKAREFMIPRTEVVALDESLGIDELRDSFIESSLSKILIYKDSVDNIIGYTHSFELFKKPKDIKSILRPVSFIPESMPANEILNLLIRERRSIAVVLDSLFLVWQKIYIPYRKLALQLDLLYHVHHQFPQEIDYLNIKYDLKLPESENYSTLGGLVINYLESIPPQGEEFHLPPYVFTVEDVSESKINTIRLRISED